MKIKSKKVLCAALCFLLAFVLWTILICFVDVKPIGANNTCVGLATVNEFFHERTGVNLTLYVITDWLSIVPLIFIIGFGTVGFIQLIKRKNLFKVDGSILVLGVFYLIVLALYFSFEIFVVNWRPILINGNLEASYPSSTTMLVICVMPTAVMQLKLRIKHKTISRCIAATIYTFTALMVAARLISGVHWLTDIIGGTLLSVGLVLMYKYFQVIVKTL